MNTIMHLKKNCSCIWQQWCITHCTMVNKDAFRVWMADVALPYFSYRREYKLSSSNSVKLTNNNMINWQKPPPLNWLCAGCLVFPKGLKLQRTSISDVLAVLFEWCYIFYSWFLLKLILASLFCNFIGP